MGDEQAPLRVEGEGRVSATGEGRRPRDREAVLPEVVVDADRAPPHDGHLGRSAGIGRGVVRLEAGLERLVVAGQGGGRGSHEQKTLHHEEHAADNGEGTPSNVAVQHATPLVPLIPLLPTRPRYLHPNGLWILREGLWHHAARGSAGPVTASREFTGIPAGTTRLEEPARRRRTRTVARRRGLRPAGGPSRGRSSPPPATGPGPARCGRPGRGGR